MHALHASASPVTAEHLSRLLRGLGRFAILLLDFALVIGAVVSLRFGLYEYGHGNAPLVRHMIGTLVSGLDQTSR